MNHSLKPALGPLLLLTALTVVAFLTRPMTPIDETRYISVAWEMWLRDEYLVLFKNGETYSHKPPLLFWLYNLGWAVFGFNEWWPRLVSPLFSAGGVLLTLSIARKLWPQADDAHRNAVWILASSLLWMVFSTSAMFDVMLAFFVLLGMRGILIAAQDSIQRGFAWLAVSIGLGVLAKGPVVLLHLLPLAVLAPWWLVAQTRQPNWKHWYGAILLAVLGGAAIALAWAIPAAIHGGEAYRNAIFWGQTANRMVDSFAHQRPIWWYLPLLPVLLFPWFVWPTLWRKFAALKHQGVDLGTRFCLAWMLPVFVAFSFISGKQIHYLIPLFPAFALLAGRALDSDVRANIVTPAIIVAIIGAAMIYIAFAGLPGEASVWTGFGWWAGGALLVAAGVAAWRVQQKKNWLPGLAVLGTAFFALVQFYLAPAAGHAYDMHPIAQEIRKLQDRGIAVANSGKYHAQFQFAGRLHKPLTELKSDNTENWLAAHPDGVVVVYLSRREEIPSGAIFSQPYRGEMAVLLSARQVAALGGLKGKRVKKIKPEEEAE